MESLRGGKSVFGWTILEILEFDLRTTPQRILNEKLTFTMKPLCFSGMIFGAFVVLLFGLDLAIKLPFGRPSWILNTGFIIMGGILIYTGWATQKEQR